MKVLLTILGLVLALPVIIAVGMALGPAILVVLLILVFAAPVLLAQWMRMRRG